MLRSISRGGEKFSCNEKTSAHIQLSFQTSKHVETLRFCMHCVGKKPFKYVRFCLCIMMCAVSVCEDSLVCYCMSVTIARVLCSNKYFAYAIIFTFFLFLFVNHFVYAIFVIFFIHSCHFIYYWLVCTLEMIFWLWKTAQDLFFYLVAHFSEFRIYIFIILQLVFCSLSFVGVAVVVVVVIQTFEKCLKWLYLMVANRVTDFIVLFQSRWQIFGSYEY